VNYFLPHLFALLSQFYKMLYITVLENHGYGNFDHGYNVSHIRLRAGRPGDRGSIPGRGRGFFL
jgi:hypothetical protein